MQAISELPRLNCAVVPWVRGLVSRDGLGVKVRDSGT